MTHRPARPGNRDAGVRALGIVIDENIPGVEATFARHGRVKRVNGRALQRATLRGADALIVRSVTRVGPDLLADRTVKFVGSATIGTDHLDLEWLQEQGIRWASAPGCNADAAAQYTLAMMLLSARRLGFELTTRRIAIVGHGNVGSRVKRLLSCIGAHQLIACDPPLAEAGNPGLAPMEEVAGCDLISLHVPLTRSGRWPTRHLVDGHLLDQLPQGTLVVNTARGEVIDTRALTGWLSRGRGHAALDVWPGEPEIPAPLVRRAVVATPHVAGYSLDGKMRGTLQVYDAFCDWLGVVAPQPDLVATLPSHALLHSDAATVESAVLAACPVGRDDASLRALLADGSRPPGSGFDSLRRTYPDRRDFAGWTVPADVPRARCEELVKLGFH